LGENDPLPEDPRDKEPELSYSEKYFRKEKRKPALNKK
jgi:hypothetical protein